MEEVTLYLFTSEIKSFLKKLSKQPVSCDVNDLLKEMGFTKESLIKELLDRNFIKKNTKIENGMSAKDDRYSISYEFFAKGFERKMERFYNDWKRKNNQKKVNESTATGAVTPGIGAESTEGNTGAFVKPLEMEGNDNVIRKTKKIHITQKQLDEATSTFSVGDYQYDVPFPTDKNDPTLTRKKGFSMERLK